MVVQNLNTSHVTVNQKEQKAMQMMDNNLNTSHVTVNPLKICHFYTLIKCIYIRYNNIFPIKIPAVFLTIYIFLKNPLGRLFKPY